MTRKKTSIIWTIQRDELERIVQDSKTLKEVLSHFYLRNEGNYRTLKARLAADNIDFSHIRLGRGNFRGGGPKAIPLSEVMVENSTYARGHLKARLLKEKLLKEECSRCHIGPEWYEECLVFVLDHVNGISNDHRLENLRLLCPNCNSQMPTFAGRNQATAGTRQMSCSQCKKTIIKRGNKTGLCHQCFNRDETTNIARRKVKNRPSKEKLQVLLVDNPWTAVGRMYGVWENTVRKWARGYGLSTKRRR